MPRRPAPPPPQNGTVGMPAFLDTAPWYVKLVVWLLVWFGFPVAMTIALFMVVIGYIPSPLTSLDKEMTRHVEDMRKVLNAVEANERVYRQICRNTSTNAVERRECDR